MKVYLFYTNDSEKPEGVYTAAGKDKKDEELFDQALQRKNDCCSRLTAEIVELRDMRKSYITEAELLLEKERKAKASNHTGNLKAVRKQRRVILRQIERLYYEISKREDRICEMQCMVKSDTLSHFGQAFWWEEHYVQGE